MRALPSSAVAAVMAMAFAGCATTSVASSTNTVELRLVLEKAPA